MWRSLQYLGGWRGAVASLHWQSLVVVLLLGIAACGSSTGRASSTPTATPSPTPTATSPATPGVTGYPVKVYFSKSPDSLNTFGAVFPVARVSPTLAVGTFAIQLLIAGPTLEERAAGYFSELNGLFSGPSRCTGPTSVSGPDVILTLDMKGTTPQPGTATLKFCRPTASPGIGADARVLAEIGATLRQFPNMTKVVVLDVNGHCFGDESGQDRCLK